MKTLKTTLYILAFINLSLLAQTGQETIIKLPTTDNSSSFNITKSNDDSIFKLNADGGFYLQGTLGSGAKPIADGGPKTMLMWYPNRAAFRVGYVHGAEWDDANIGLFSTSMGYSSIAIGDYSIAIGENTTASGQSSTAMGKHTNASGKSSTAMGEETTSSGDYSTAIGSYVSTNAQLGSFIIGDRSTYTVTSNDATNQMMMRFTGGYKLLGGGVLQNAGLIESTTGGFKFPDGTTQASAAATATTYWTASGNNVYNSNSGNIGISETTPTAELHVGGTDGFLVEGTYSSGTIPTTGAGTRMMFYPNKAAFRVGYVGSTQWDDANIGDYSVAMGYSTTASGDFSTAMGNSTTASGAHSTAMGNGTTASASRSTAMGYGTTASGGYSTAMGHNTTASEPYSTAMGYYTTASGYYSTAMGNSVSTNGKQGSFIIGDKSTTTVTNCGSINQMMMRFANGYTFYTNSVLSAGVTLSAGGSSWSSVSDSTKKENILLADGEYFLNSISKLRLGSWNYKEQDAKDFRHYGPMAQEIFYYFGKDEYGTIGCDTLLTTADMDGIMMIALQALEVRSKKLDLRCETLEKQSIKQQLTINDLRLTKEEQEVRNERLEESNKTLATRNTELETRFAKLEKLVSGLIENSNIEVAIK